MQTLSEIRQLLADRGLRPKHRLGQNFLHDHNLIRKMVDAAELAAGDVVLEVGPGTGTLTEELLDGGARVIACELDRDLADVIQQRLSVHCAPERASLTLIRGDCLEKQRRLNPEVVTAVGNRPFKLVANLPYQAASPLISALLTDHPNCIGQFVTIQKEVADRLMAKPSTKEYGPLSIIVQAFALVRRIATLSPGCFWPEPEVTSAMVAIVPHRSDAAAPGSGGFDSSENRRGFARFIVDLFTKRRKQLGSILGRERSIWPHGVEATMRPEALSISQAVELWRIANVPRENA